MVKVIGVKFDSTYAEYAFKTDIEDIQVEDKVVCDTSRGMSLGTVSSIKGDESKATKWVIQRIDMTAFNERQEKEKALEALKKKMDKRKKELDEAKSYEFYAAQDAKMAELYAKYVNTLEG